MKFSTNRFLFGSSIVIARRLDEVVIGADSLQVGTDLAKAGTVCKILQIGNVFFANAGIQGNPTLGLSVHEKVREVAATSKTANEMHRKLPSVVNPMLFKAIQDTKNRYPEFYKSRIENRAVLSYAFIGIENGQIIIPFMNAIVTPNEDAQMGFQIEFKGRDDLKPTGDKVQTLIFGYQNAIREELAENPDLWDKGLVKAVRRLIETQIERTPEMVGPPIAILYIKGGSARWEHQAHCKKIQKL